MVVANVNYTDVGVVHESVTFFAVELQNF